MDRSIQNMCIVLLLVLGATVTQAGADVFTVDVNGGGNFTTIQDAVDHANVGDTIVVNPGVYRENVAVNKELTILSNPALSANDTMRTYVIGTVSDNGIFDINSNNVKIDGFYIMGGSSGVKRDEIGINLNGVENCSLSNNKLILNDVGVALNGSKNNYLESNLVSLGSKGITLVSSDGNILYNNTITTNSEGISLNNSVNNTLFNNIADANMVGVYLGTAQGNMLTYNIIMRNINGINGETANSNYMINNTLYLNDIGINLTGSSENSIYENQFDNLLDAVDDGHNIWNSTSKGNFWQNYTVQDADGNGIGDTPRVINQTTGSIDYMPVLSVNTTENAGGSTTENTDNSSTNNSTV